MRPALAPLRLPAYRRLAATYTLNELADWLATTALAILVFQETGDALATTAFFLASKFLPAFLVPMLAARLDQWPAGRALAVLYVGEAVTLAVLAVTADGFLLPLVLGLALVDGTLALGGRALSRASVALVLEPHGNLREGNALINVLFSAAAVGGPAIAGALCAVAGEAFAIAVAAAIFGAMAVVAGTGSGLPAGQTERQPWFDRARAGLGYVRAHPRLSRLLTAQGVGLVFFSAILPLEVIYAKEELDAGDDGLGFLLASWGAGMVLGSLAFVRMRRQSITFLMTLATAAVGASYLGMAAAETLALACLLSVLGGIGNGIQLVAVITAMQEATVADLQARVAAFAESISAAAPGVGFLLGGAVASGVGVRTAYVVAAGGVLLAVLLFARVGMGSSPPARPAALGAVEPWPPRPEVESLSAAPPDS